MKKSYTIPIKSFLPIFLLLFLSSMAFSQRKITGKVIAGDDNTGLPGATVQVKGTDKGSITDENGAYSLDLPADANTLVVSSVGYLTQELSVGASNTIDVTLQSDDKTLSEVVVTGYGTQSKRDITGAVAVLESAKLLNVPASNLGQALQGKVAGVTVGNDNSPGGGVSVRVRGFGTINDNSPLYIVDGTPTKGSLTSINPNDIESIQVLKDASAASIYGSRAGNGVVIVTTKKGKLGKAKITYDAYYGTQNAGKKFDILNSKEYLDLYWRGRTLLANESALKDGNLPANPVNPNIAFFGGQTATPRYPDFVTARGGVLEGDAKADPALYNFANRYLIYKVDKNGTDWFDEVFKSAPIQNHQVGVSGATENSRYSLGVNYFDQPGIMQFTNFKRYSVRANTEFKIANRIKIGENIQVAYTDRVGQLNGNQNEGNAVAFIHRLQPFIPLKDIQGNYAGTFGDPALSNSSNPVADLFRNKDNVNKNMRIFGNIYADVDIVKDLTFRSSFGVDYDLYNNRSYRANNPEAAEMVGFNQLQTNSSYDWTWTWYNTLTYSKTFAEKHRFNFIAGVESIKSYFEFLTAGRTNFVSDDPSNRYLNAGAKDVTNNNNGTEWRLASEFGKLNYAFNDRYLLDATIRRDRSSRFAPSFRVATFPAVSAGWIVSKEDFLKNTPISFLKLRAGWGQTGNQEIGPYNSFSTFGSDPASSFYSINGSPTSSVQGYDLGQFGNPEAKWETTTSTNFGLDAKFLKDKFNFSIDVFSRRTTDMLFPVEPPLTQGVAVAPFRNIGEMINTGIELGLGYDASINRDLSVSFNVIFSTYNNEVVKTNGNPATLYPGFSNLRLPTGTVSYTQQGRPIASFYGLTIDGIFQTDKEGSDYLPQFGGTYNKAGLFKYRDSNGDGKISNDDISFIGSPHPDFTYGMNLGVNYKGFALDIMGQGVQGNKIFNFTRYWTDFPTFAGNRSRVALNESWLPGRTDAKLAIFGFKENISSLPSTYYLEDGSYFRLTNIQLTYNIPTSITSKIGLDNLAVYFQGQNLLTITNYSGLDPDINARNFTAGSDRMLGVDESAYPSYKALLFGVRVGF
jgi:TonB-dependent starch-binding outer membrane protein SusC